MTAGAAWTTQSERSNQAMLRLMTWISLRLGRRVARVVLVGIAAYFVAFAPRARRASRDYLSRALGRRAGLRDAWRHMFSFAATVHDRVYLLNDRFDLFDIRLQGAELVDAALADGRGVLLVGAHLGSFEVLRALSRRRGGMRVCMMMYEDNARKINAALQAINPHASHDIIALGRPDAMLRLSEALDSGAVVGLLADRTLHGDGSVQLPLLGTPAPWPLGPWRIAALLRRPVLLAVGLYRGGNRYDVTFSQLADFSITARAQRDAAMRAAAAAYAAAVQQYCLDAPYNWFNFYDFWTTPSSPQPAR